MKKLRRIKEIWSSSSSRCRCVAVDIFLIGLGGALWLGAMPIVTFHLIFVTLTIAAFLLEPRRFMMRLAIGTLVGAIGIVLAISSGKLDSQEIVEVPLLALIAALVALIARRRSATEVALRQTHAELLDVTARYEMLLTSVPAVVYTAEVGAQGEWVFAGAQAQSLLGIDAADLMSGAASWVDAIHPEDRDRVLAEELQAFETGTPFASEYRIVMPDGEQRWLRDEAVLAATNGARPPCFHGVMTDVTAQKQLQHDLATRVRQEAATAELGRMALIDDDIDALLDRAVHLISETLEVEYCKVLELLPGDDELLLRTGVGWEPGLVGRAVVESGRASQAGFTLIADGPVLVDDLASETRFTGPQLLIDHGVRSGLSTVIRENGRHYGVLGAHTNHRRRFTREDGEFLSAMANVLAAAIRLERSESKVASHQRRFEAAFNAAVSAIALIRPGGEFISVNDAMARMLGYSMDEMTTSLNFRSITHPDDVDACMQAASDIVLGQRDHARLLKRYVGQRGETVWADLSLSAVRDGGGAVEYFVAQSFDVTDKVLAVATRERFFETSIDLMCIAGFDGYFKEVNPAWEKTLGYTREELLAVPYVDLVHPDDREETEAEAINLTRGIPALEFSNRYFHKDGSVRWLEWRAIPIPDEQSIVATARDVTAHRALELQLRQAQKMEAIGLLAGGIAHDFNNLLGVILNYCDFIRDAGASDDVAADLQEIREAAERGARLVGQLLAFSRRDVPQAQLIQLNEVLAGFQKLLERTLGEDICLDIGLAEDLPLIQADPGHLDQIVMNLAVNARDAMPTGGALVLETSTVELADERQIAGGTVPPGTYVCLMVSDTGTGIAAQDLERVFEPFFTTKAVGEGTGLGLATTYAIVVEAGGYIGVYSEVGHGTTFHLYWPVADGAGALGKEAIEAKAGSSPKAGSVRVLVIEDDDAIRKILQKVLIGAGHEVVVAANGEEATSVASEAHFDLLLSDVIMPGRSGPDVARDLRDLGYVFETIYMSGYTNNVISRQATIEKGSFFIQKPFQASDLLRKIDEVMAS